MTVCTILSTGTVGVGVGILKNPWIGVGYNL